MKIGGLREDILFESKEYPLALPKKDCQGGFRISPLTTPLKRPKEGLRPFLWKPSRGHGGFRYEGRWDGGRKMEALMPAVIPGILACGRRG